MPVGVPKVPFQNPEDEDATWVDLYHRLSRERLIFLGQAIKSRIANQIAGLMIYLSLEDSSRDLFLFINSPGGWMIDGVLIFDTIGFVKPDVNTVCFGVAVSMASFVLAGGTFTKRLAFPHGRVMIHQPLADLADSNTIEMTWDGEELLRLRNLIAHTYASRTGKPIWIISEDMERDVFMSATEAHDYGIVDLVATEDNIDEISDGLDLLAHDLRLEVGDRSLVAHDPDLVAHDFGLVETDDDDDISDTDFW